MIVTTKRWNKMFEEIDWSRFKEAFDLLDEHACIYLAVKESWRRIGEPIQFAYWTVEEGDYYSIDLSGYRNDYHDGETVRNYRISSAELFCGWDEWKMSITSLISQLKEDHEAVVKKIDEETKKRELEHDHKTYIKLREKFEKDFVLDRGVYKQR